MLAACESGEHNGDAAFVPLGEALVAEGLAERVIAMNGLFGIRNAGRFAGRLYRQLLAHRLIDLAVNEAREQLGREEDYGTPVLFRG